jgi:hypothetical protein
VPDGKDGHDVGLTRPEEVEEEWSGIGIGASGVDVCQRVGGPLQNEVMHRREQCRRQMGRRRCGAYEVEEFVISGNRQRDALVER